MGGPFQAIQSEPEGSTNQFSLCCWEVFLEISTASNRRSLRSGGSQQKLALRETTIATKRTLASGRTKALSTTTDIASDARSKET